MSSLRQGAIIVAGTALAALLAGASCNDSPVEPPFVTSIRVVWTVPGPLAQLENNDPFDISLDFSRSVGSLERAPLLLVPAPDSTDIMRLSKSKQNLTWFGVHTKDNSKVQHLLIDGPDFTAPTLLIWLTGTPEQAELSGEIDTRDEGAENRRVDHTVVFAMPANDLFNPFLPETFDDALPLSMAKPDSLNSLSAVGNYRMRRMPAGAEVYVVAIYDSSGDGKYSPLDDWWGVYRDPNTGQFGEVTVWPICNDCPGPPGDLNISLGPPSQPPG